MNRLTITALTSLALTGGCASAAHANDRHVVAAGGVSALPCDSGSPCTLSFAMGGGSVIGDRLLLASGTYDVGSGFKVVKRLTVTAEPSALSKPLLATNAGTKKVLEFAAGSAGSVVDGLELKENGTDGVALNAAESVTVRNSILSGNAAALQAYGGGTFEDLTLTQLTAAIATGVQVSGPVNAPVSVRRLTVTGAGAIGAISIGLPADGVAEDVTVNAAGSAGAIGGSGTFRRFNVTSAGFAGLTVAGGTLTDSIIRATSGDAVIVAGSSTLRNVTAVASAPNSVGVRATKSDNIPGDHELALVNSVIRGVTTDLVAEPKSMAVCFPTPDSCGAGKITVDHSNYRTSAGPVTAGAGNQSGDPLFVSATDLHVKPSSPVRDVGIAGAGDGPTDVDGGARVQGSAIDIGADELAPLLVIDPGAPAPPGPPGTPGPDASDVTAPVLSLLRRTSKAFSFALDEAASIKVTIAKASKGRRSKGTCVKATRKLRKPRSCTRYATVGSLTRAGTVGANTLAFTTKLGSKTLSAGSYRATFVATDAAGNAGRARSVTFTVRKRRGARS